MIRILFQGDSITDGNRYRDEETRWDLNHQIGHSYAYLIASHFGRLKPGKYHFINRAVSGDCVDKAAARWQTDVLDEKPDVLSILLGINGNHEFDGHYPQGIEAHLLHFDKTYRLLLNSAIDQNPNLHIVIIEPFILPVGRYKEHYNAFTKVFARKREIIKKIADDFAVNYVDFYNETDISPEKEEKYFHTDGVHTNKYGFLEMAKLISRILRDRYGN